MVILSRQALCSGQFLNLRCCPFQVGEIRRNNLSRNPELLPYGYIFGDVTDIRVRLRRSTSQHRGSGLSQPPVDELVNVAFLTFWHCHTTSHCTTPHPVKRARRWYTVVTLPYQCDQIWRFIGLWVTFKAFGNN